MMAYLTMGSRESHIMGSRQSHMMVYSHHGLVGNLLWHISPWVVDSLITGSRESLMMAYFTMGSRQFHLMVYLTMVSG